MPNQNEKIEDTRSCQLAIFMENGDVFGYFVRNTLEAKLEFNYGVAHEVKYIGKYTRSEIKIMYPHASFVNFNQLGKHRIERKKINENYNKQIF